MNRKKFIHSPNSRGVSECSLPVCASYFGDIAVSRKRVYERQCI